MFIIRVLVQKENSFTQALTVFCHFINMVLTKRQFRGQSRKMLEKVAEFGKLLYNKNTKVIEKRRLLYEYNAGTDQCETGKV